MLIGLRRSLAGISFHKKITLSILGERMEILPAVDNGSSIDFLDAFEYSGLEFAQRLDSDVAKKASSHLAEESLDNVEP